MKKVFNDKRIRIVLVSCLAIALLVIGGIYAARTVARNSSIGEDAAASFAYIDAEVESKDVNTCNVEFKYKEGTYVYIVKFSTDKAKYSYVVKASNGIILSKDVKKIKNTKKAKKTKKKQRNKKKNRKKQNSKKDNSKIVDNNEEDKAVGNKTPKIKSTSSDDNSNDYITVDKAKSIARASSGENNVVFTTTQMGTDNGIDVYYIFFTAGNTDYQYTINAKSGAVINSQKIVHKDQNNNDNDDEGDDDDSNDGDEEYYGDDVE